MRLPEPPRRKGGPRQPLLSLCLFSQDKDKLRSLPQFPSGEGAGAPLAAGEKRTESCGERSAPAGCSPGRAAGAGVRSSLSSERGLLRRGCSWTEMVSCLLAAPTAAALVQSLFLCVRDSPAPHQTKDMANLSQLCSDQGCSPLAAAADQ